jgi:hypothetical protein
MNYIGIKQYHRIVVLINAFITRREKWKTKHTGRMIVLLLVIVMVLTSCLGIRSDLSFQNDGSGNIALTYQISALLQELGKIGEEEKPLPFPVHKEDFLRVVNEVEGLSLTSYSRTETDETIIIKAVISFTSPELLAYIDGSEEKTIRITRQGDHTSFKQSLPVPVDEELSEDTIAMISEFFPDYKLVYVINTPRPILEYNCGELSKNKQSLTYEITILDILTIKEIKTIEVKW